MKTLQEAFDTALEGLREQGKQSLDGGVCAYRSHQDDGTCLKCGIGFLIHDTAIDQYFIEELNGESVGDSDEVLRYIALSDYPVDAVSRQFYKNIQSIHDLYSPLRWEECFEQLAKGWNLVYTPDPKFRLSPVKLAGKED